MDLTNQEIFMLLFSIACIMVIVGFIFTTIFKFAVSAALCCLLFGIGFGWLPEQMERIKNGDTTVNEVLNEAMNEIPVNEIKNGIEEGSDYIKDHADSWLESLKTAWEKVLGTYEKPTEEIK